MTNDKPLSPYTRVRPFSDGVQLQQREHQHDGGRFIADTAVTLTTSEAVALRDYLNSLDELPDTDPSDDKDGDRTPGEKAADWLGGEPDTDGGDNQP